MKDGTLFHRDPQHDYPIVVKGEGIYLYDEEGNRFIDGTAGAGNVILGHGRRRIAEVMADQASTLAYCFSAFHTNRPAMALAARIAAVAPVDDGRVYLVSGGSEGIETAFKLARQYHLLEGEGRKQKIISRWRSYHGASLGALGATGIPQMRAPFAPWLPDFEHIDPCYPYRCALRGCAGTCGETACAGQLEKAILQAGPDNVAAFVAEPVVMAGVAAGVPPPEYFARIRAICDKYNVLLIADEVITGFGRTGRYFAIEHWGVRPDIVVFGKGASSGYMPLGGVVMSGKIASGFVEAGAFFQHIFTYVNNPVAARVGLEVMDIIEEEGVIAHAAETGDYLQTRARELSDHPMVGDIRGRGMMLGIELVKDRETGQPFPAAEKVSGRLCRIALKRGLSVSGVSGAADWVDGDDLRFYPPLVISREEIDLSLAIIHESLSQIEEELGMG